MSRILPTILVSLSLLTTSIVPASESALREAGQPFGLRLAGSEDLSASKVYIVQLAAPSAAEHHAALVKQAHVAAAPRPRLDPNNAAIKSHTAELAAAQDAVLDSLAESPELLYRYYFGLNGFAARLNPAEAHKLERDPRVLAVWEDEVRPLATEFSLNFLELFDSNEGLRSAVGLDGEDVIIGFIDSGVHPEHPQLSDTREAERPRACQGSWAENTLLGRWLCRRYRRADDIVNYEPITDWNGTCQIGEDFEETACNNKLIGARWFVAGAEATGPIDEGEIRSARDVDGHGTHTATTAAGNAVSASIFGTRIGNIQGIAPRARVAVYKACWLRPDDTRAACNTSDLANAIDAAVADGVDVINYSVGNSMLRIAAPDDQALLAATKAGVLAVVAAGNEGPNFGTIGSPGGGPWAITAAASTREGETSLEALEIDAPANIAGRYAVREANFTPPISDRDPIEAAVVLADDDETTLADGGTGTTADACEPLVNDQQLGGAIVLIQRGGCDFDAKLVNAENGGAIAAIVYNFAGEPFVMNGATGLSDIPAVMLGQADGNTIVAELDAGNDVTAILDKSLFLTQADTGNRIASFSSRGPAPVNDILKPDVTAPGVNILAGFTPNAVNSTPNELYAYLSGTSMSTPHVAGVAALLREANPQWSPAAIKSALMTTARQDLGLMGSESTPIPFDFGAGHIVPNDALNPGLVYDVGDDDYDAFACGFGLASVPVSRCAALIDAGMSILPADMNQPSVTVSRLANQRTVARRVTNVSEESQQYSASVSAPDGISVTIDPPVLSLAPGETATFDVSLQYASGPLDQWRFGELTWDGSDHNVRSTLAIRPVSLTAPLQRNGIGGSGSLNFDVEFGYSGAYTPQVHGLRLPLVINGFVDNDPTKTFSFRTVNGVTAHLIDVPANQLYLRFALFDELTDGDEDLDLYIYFCPDGINCFRLGESGEPTSTEEFDVFQPAAGRYAALVHGFETDEISGGPGSNYQLAAWSLGQLDDQGNMAVSAPSIVAAGTTETVTIDWSNLESQTIYLGAISHNTPQGLSGLTIIQIVN